jgi:hypothetical protein
MNLHHQITKSTPKGERITFRPVANGKVKCNQTDKVLTRSQVKIYRRAEINRILVSKGKKRNLSDLKKVQIPELSSVSGRNYLCPLCKKLTPVNNWGINICTKCKDFFLSEKFCAEIDYRGFVKCPHCSGFTLTGFSGYKAIKPGNFYCTNCDKVFIAKRG